MAFRALTSCQHDECQAEVSYDLKDLRMFADRPVCWECYYDGAYGKEKWEDLPPCLPIDYEGLEGMTAFLGDLFRLYRDSDHMDIDGCDFQEMLDKHGLVECSEITEADGEWAADLGYEHGDTFYRYTPAMLTLIRRGS
ncbi:MAG: hypothetical protein IH926_00015 [Proteobacteria bacterium]|nr:hypothetical protein [Pseudomonadota bacterium]